MMSDNMMNLKIILPVFVEQVYYSLKFPAQTVNL